MKTLSDKIETYIMDLGKADVLIPKCNWKVCADGNGTTFQSRNKDNLNCFKCEGYDINCRNYFESYEELRK